jgi:predicted nucleotidyltransferase
VGNTIVKGDDMDIKDHEILNRLKRLLQKRVRLYKIILFGSRARGDAEPDSDMDVLVILDEPGTPEKLEAVLECAWEAGFDEGIVVAPIMMSRTNWETGPEKASLLAIAVREEGVTI